MSKRFGKKRVSGCECTHGFTCGPCLRAAGPTLGLDVSKMMPGQAPYTAEEASRLTGLLASACHAEELFSDDELERHVEQMRKASPKP